MLQLPELVETVARTLEPHHLPHYAQELATAFHWFYKQCRVISDDHPELTAARLKLVDASRITLARTLRLMGMAAPTRCNGTKPPSPSMGEGWGEGLRGVY